MKKKLSTVFRYAFPALLLLFVISCRFVHPCAEAYALYAYPVLSGALSAFSSLFPFSLEEVLVVSVVGWMFFYPVLKRKKGEKWKHILGRELEVAVWMYVWFYLGWGLNYFRFSIYERSGVPPQPYNEQKFLDFLNVYTDSLNGAYLPETYLDKYKIGQEVKAIYRQVPASLGLAYPKPYQMPKRLMFDLLYSKVGVLGYMGPFFSEYQLNGELLPSQIPFSYAHEYAHLLGVSNEAEANYWAYQVCIRSSMPQMRYSGYLSLLPYVLANASSLLSEEQFGEWVRRIRPEVKKDYEQKRVYWKGKYAPLLGEVQDYIYNLFLKGNNIPSGKKNYAEVIGILLAINHPFALPD